MVRCYFTHTKSHHVRKDEGKPGGKIPGKLGRMVVRNTQPMPLTSRPAASRASLRSLPHLLSHFLLLKNFQTTWTDKLRGIEELRGRLKDIALAFGCTFCSHKLGAGNCVVRCGHTCCNRQNASAKAGSRKCLGVAGGDPQEERVDKAV